MTQTTLKWHWTCPVNKDGRVYWAEKYWPNEPPYDKTSNTTCVPSKNSDQPGHPPCLIESSLSAWRNHGSLATHWEQSEDSDQTGWMPRLICVFTLGTSHFVSLSWAAQIQGVNHLKAQWSNSNVIFIEPHTIKLSIPKLWSLKKDLIKPYLLWILTILWPIFFPY